jgi:hypothetical protein
VLKECREKDLAKDLFVDLARAPQSAADEACPRGVARLETSAEVADGRESEQRISEPKLVHVFSGYASVGRTRRRPPARGEL